MLMFKVGVNLRCKDQNSHVPRFLFYSASTPKCVVYAMSMLTGS